MILWLVEPTELYRSRGEAYHRAASKENKTPVILVINKIDTVKKEELSALYRCVPEGNGFCRDRSGFCPETGKYRGADLRVL